MYDEVYGYTKIVMAKGYNFDIKVIKPDPSKTYNMYLSILNRSNGALTVDKIGLVLNSSNIYTMSQDLIDRIPNGYYYMDIIFVNRADETDISRDRSELIVRSDVEFGEARSSSYTSSPSTSTISWGNISGDISLQVDLINRITQLFEKKQIEPIHLEFLLKENIIDEYTYNDFMNKSVTAA